MPIKKDIVKFYISMNNTLLVHVCYTLHDLEENMFGRLLCKFASFPDVIKQITARTKLHNYQIMLISLERFEQSNMTWVSESS